jgi:hypothetical protein
MEKIDLEQLVKQMAFEGKGFDEIQAELSALKSRFSDDEIRSATRKIDTYIVEYQLASLEKSKGRNFMILGAFLFILGISLTIYTFLIGNSQFVLVWGAIIFGIINFVYGKQVYYSPLEELVPRQKRIKKNGTFYK